MSARRTTVKITETAKKALARLPRAARKGLLEKAQGLRDCDDPRTAGKALTGPLQGYYRIRHSRYRAIYTVDQEQLANGEVVVCVTITVVSAGVRKEGDKSDVYALAQKLVGLGLLHVPTKPSRPKKKSTKTPKTKKARKR